MSVYFLLHQVLNQEVKPKRWRKQGLFCFLGVFFSYSYEKTAIYPALKHWKLPFLQHLNLGQNKPALKRQTGFISVPRFGVFLQLTWKQPKQLLYQKKHFLPLSQPLSQTPNVFHCCSLFSLPSTSCFLKMTHSNLVFIDVSKFLFKDISKASILYTR